MTFTRLAVGALALLLIGGQPMVQSAAAADIELKMQFASPDGTPWNAMDRRFGLSRIKRPPWLWNQ